METQDILALIHPAIAVTVVFPILGITLYQAWRTRQRRLETQAGEKSKIPPIVGPEHYRVGQWLTGSVIGITLIAFAYSIFVKRSPFAGDNPFSGIFIVFIFAATLASLVFLYQARPKIWRAVFATLTGAGLVVLGLQDGVFRRDDEWFISHFYYGMAAALLMVFSVAIAPDIYQDRSQRWRLTHIILNCFALLLFLGQGFTGSRDLLEIPLSWQAPHVYQCDWQNRTCPPPPQNPQ